MEATVQPGSGEEVKQGPSVLSAAKKTEMELMLEQTPMSQGEEIFNAEGPTKTPVLNRRVGLNKPEYTPLTKQIEHELSEFEHYKNYEGIERRLLHYYSEYSQSMDSTMKYLFCFYKVSCERILSRRALLNFIKRTTTPLSLTTNIATTSTPATPSSSTT